jgi:hypothetical protein
VRAAKHLRTHPDGIWQGEILAISFIGNADRVDALEVMVEAPR